MFKYFIAAAVALAASTSYAEAVKTDKPVVCFPIKTLLKDLKNKYGEEPMVVGKTAKMEGVATAVYVNPETGTFTVVEMDDEAGCVVSLGTQIRYRFPNKLGSTM
jgi:hypothetical protein